VARCKQLRQEAAQVRGRIDRRAGAMHLRFDSLMFQVLTLARSPAALPVAFVCGVLIERVHAASPIRGVYGSLAGLLSPAKALQIATSLMGSLFR
jgi:hypothetical protein